ncbi:MAG: radical SAM protein [Candidatus Odinarchaeota archaeon]
MKSLKVKSNKITQGTKEWADSNINLYYGCSNNCRYCYAKKMAIRFKRKTNETWNIMELNLKKIEKKFRKRNGRVMFPTSHDITTETLDNCLIVLKRLVDAGNEILITSKPQLTCVKKICEKFKDHKDLIQFRFTITSNDNEKLKFWEPGAPSFEERFETLKYAFKKGFKTSISIEPFLDRNPYILVEKLKKYTTESIWIGKMNYIKSTNIKEENIDFYKNIREIIDKENLTKILKKALDYDNSFLRIKDSIYNYLFS